MIEGLTTLDFETEGIEGNPLIHPPKPVGLAIRYPGGMKEYVTDWDQMAATFDIAVKKGPTLFHNAPFDLSVARTWFGIEWPHWSQIHDTMYLVYLRDPYARSFGLKQSAERYLNQPPEEQDACKAWIMSNVAGARESNWGAFLCKVPVDILSPYAIGDVQRTFDLYAALAPDTQQGPYDRERELMPILANATIRGVRCNTPALEQALELYTGAFEQADAMLRATLQAPHLNVSSGAQLADALDLGGYIDEWVYTPKGAKSTAMDNLRVNDPALRDLLGYRSKLKTLLGTFITGWLEKEHNGRLHPSWNSTRGDRDGGTRTGRLSSSAPNFQNIPNPADVASIPGLPTLPNMRNFILPEEGHLWIKRDFSAQEIRIMAHFEGGALAEAFRQDPNLDPHELVRQEIIRIVGRDYPRKYVKETGFGILYGMGAATLGSRLGERSNVARDLMDAYKVAIPGVEKLQRGTKRRGMADQPIRTWGGRLIYKEPARVIDGRMRSFEYKLLNYLIQGSAADQTKQCIIEWDKIKGDAIFMATVHDEVNISAPEGGHHMETLRHAMDDTGEFDVPMRSEGFTGPSWGEVGDE